METFITILNAITKLPKIPAIILAAALAIKLISPVVVSVGDIHVCVGTTPLVTSAATTSKTEKVSPKNIPRRRLGR